MNPIGPHRRWGWNSTVWLYSEGSDFPFFSWKHIMHMDIFSISATPIFCSFSPGNTKWLHLTKAAITVNLFSEELTIYHLGMLCCCVSHNITHRRIMVCLNGKCITLCQTPQNLNFYSYLGKKTLNDGDVYFKSSASFNSLHPVHSVRSADHELVSQEKAILFYGLLII